MYFINILTVGKAAIYIFWPPPPFIFFGINLTDDSQEYHHGRKTLQSYPTYNMVMYPLPGTVFIIMYSHYYSLSVFVTNCYYFVHSSEINILSYPILFIINKYYTFEDLYWLNYRISQQILI